MRVGIYISDIKASSGGGYTFQGILLDGLMKFKSEHEFYIFFYKNKHNYQSTRIKLVSLKKYIFTILYFYDSLSMDAKNSNSIGVKTGAVWQHGSG